MGERHSRWFCRHSSGVSEMVLLSHSPRSQGERGAGHETPRARAARVARGQTGTLRVGFAENASWRGIVPDSFRRFRAHEPDAELQLRPAASSEQLEAVRSGGLDAGFVNFMPETDPELDQL